MCLSPLEAGGSVHQLMQFSDTTNNSGLIQDITFLTGADTNAYTAAHRTRNINRWLYKAVLWIWEASGTWEYDDSNHTDLPIATANLVDGQQDYSLPTTLLKLFRVEVKDAAGNFYKLKPKDQSDISIALTEYEKTAGLPKYYDLIGQSLFLYPKPSSSSVTTASGLKIYLARDVDEFTTTDTTQEPGIAEPFHRILSLGAAYDFAVAKGMSQATAWRQEIEQLRQELESFYGDKHRDRKTKIQPKLERYT